MRSRSTTTCRSSGLARLGLAAAGLAVAGLAAPVMGQSGSFVPWPPLKWEAQESLDSHQDAHDEGVDIVYWHDTGENEHWIYVTGWVTEMDDGDVKGTRFATFKYDAADDGSSGTPTPIETAYYPPLSVDLVEGDSYKAVAMLVDSNTGDIYVTGEGPSEPGGAHQDYILIRYDKDLGTPWESVGTGEIERFYDGPVSGDDIPADIALDYCGQVVIAVTGTSPGNGTGLDIATAAWLTSNGDPASSYWPSDGVRRYNYEPEDGDDRAAAIAGVCTASDEEEQFILEAIVLGTSWGGTSTEDDYTYHKWAGPSTSPFFDTRYDNGGNDVGVAMSPFGDYVTGYSEDGSDFDFATLRYDVVWGSEVWSSPERLDYMNDDDCPLDLHVYSPPFAPTQVWLTGTGTDGAYADALTVRYLDNGGTVTDTWWHGWAKGYDFHYGKAITTYAGEPYIAGAIGASGVDRMAVVAYEKDAVLDYDHYWDTMRSGPYIGSVSNEGRGIAVAVVDPSSPAKRSIFVVGVSTKSGEGREFTTWRYKEE